MNMYKLDTTLFSVRDEDALVTTMYEEACTYSSTVGEQGAGAGEEEKAEKQRMKLRGCLHD